MTLLEKLDADFRQALKNKDEQHVSVIRMLKAAAKNKQIEFGKDLVDADILALIKTQIKQLKDAIDTFAKAGRTELVQKNEKEIDLLSGYLPDEISDDKIKEIIQKVIEKTEADSTADFGKVMGLVMKEIGSSADGGRVRGLVQKLLG